MAGQGCCHFGAYLIEHVKCGCGCGEGRKQCFRIPLRNTYVAVMCDHVTWSTRYGVFRQTFVTVFYERFRKVCPQCNTVVHAMECNRSMRLRKVCAQCNTVVHVKRSVCDCGHAFESKKGKHSVLLLGSLRTQ